MLRKEGSITAMTLDAISEVRKALSDWYVALPELSSDSASPKIKPPLDMEEAEDFLCGLREELFTVDSDGYVQSQFLPPAPAQKSRQEILQLFWHYKGRRILFREGVCQLAAVSSLVARCGLPPASVRLEPNTGDVGDVAFGVDIIVRDPADDSVRICGEVKRNTAELSRLLEELTACLRDGRHSKRDCIRKNHTKAEALWKLRPECFWAVCPGKRLAFHVQHRGSLITLEEIPGLPQAPA